MTDPAAESPAPSPNTPAPLGRATLVQVRDDGVGMDEETLRRVHTDAATEPSADVPTDEEANPRHGGVGLRNISQRLALLFGDRYELTVRSHPDEGTAVRLRIPLR
jgi:sensor histidine kinase YesM